MSLLIALAEPAPAGPPVAPPAVVAEALPEPALRAVPRAAGVHLVALDGAGGASPGGSTRRAASSGGVAGASTLCKLAQPSRHRGLMEPVDAGCALATGQGVRPVLSNEAAHRTKMATRLCSRSLGPEGNVIGMHTTSSISTRTRPSARELRRMARSTLPGRTAHDCLQNRAKRFLGS